jgi:hypothetical protein
MSFFKSDRKLPALVAITLVLWTAVPNAAWAGGSGNCAAPLVGYHGGPTVCYLPSQIAAAERRFGHLPVRPVAALRRVVPSLKLGQILLVGAGPLVKVRAEAITYVFGVPEPACSSTPGCGHGDPYAIVQETIGLLPTLGLIVTEDPNFAPGPWHVSGNLPLRRLTLSIDTNLGRSATVHIARLIVGRAARR